MNHLSQKLMCLTLLVSTVHFASGTTTNIVPRSQGFNAARQLIGWNNPEWGINRLPQDQWYSSFNLAFEYTRTFRDNSLAYALFGDDLVCGECDETSLIISGSAVPNRNGETDWLADYFGLPRDFQSTINFKPSITNFILDISFYAGLDNWLDGLYVKLYGPFVHTKWNLNAEECGITGGNFGYFQGYFSSVDVESSNLNKGFLAYANGETPTIPNNYDLYGEYECQAGVPPFHVTPCTPLGDISWNPLCCGRISPECGCDGQGLTRNGFAELRFILGYNFVNNEDGDYHLGVGIHVAAPTGTSVGSGCNGNYLFAPVVGNGHHWELGGQVTAHHIWWRSEDENKSFGFYLEADVTHLFGTSQTRCFDLCSAGSNSRYMLAQQLTSNSNSSPRLNLETDSLGYQFGNVYTPVANLTRREVTSSIGVQGDVALSLAYQTGGFQWDIGYDFWGRSCEKLSLKDDCCPTPFGTWALKGDQRVYGFLPVYDDYVGLEAELVTALAATDSQANIHQGSNLRNNVNYQTDLPLAPKNLYADNPTPALGGPAETSTLDIYTLPYSDTQIYTSEKPVTIKECDLNLKGTRGITNKLFTHLNYAWADRDGDCKWTPYVGIGAEVEFGPSADNNCCPSSSCNPCDTSSCSPCNTPCNTPCSTSCDDNNCCSNVALSQWGVWFKVGTSYN